MYNMYQDNTLYAMDAANLFTPHWEFPVYFASSPKHSTSTSSTNTTRHTSPLDCPYSPCGTIYPDESRTFHFEFLIRQSSPSPVAAARKIKKRLRHSRPLPYHLRKENPGAEDNQRDKDVTRPPIKVRLRIPQSVREVWAAEEDEKRQKAEDAKRPPIKLRLKISLETRQRWAREEVEEFLVGVRRMKRRVERLRRPRDGQMS